MTPRPYLLSALLVLYLGGCEAWGPPVAYKVTCYNPDGTILYQKTGRADNYMQLPHFRGDPVIYFRDGTSGACNNGIVEVVK